MLYPILIALLLFVPQLNYGQQKIERERLQEEFKILKVTLEELHPDLHRYVGRKEFDACADSIMNSLHSDLTPIEFYLKISPLVTQIKNGHTSIRLPHEINDRLKVLPLRLILLEGKAYVYRDLSQRGSILRGSEVSAIDNVPVEEIMRRSMPFVSVDGFNDHARVKAIVEDDLALYYSLLWGESEEFLVEFIDQDSQQRISQKVSALTYGEFLSRYDEEDAPPWSLTRFDQSNTALLRLRTFNNLVEYRNEKIYFHKAIKEFFQKIRMWNTENLILDIRFNGGGELKNSILLYSYLAVKPFQFAKHVGMASLNAPTYIQFTNYQKALKFGPIDRVHAVQKSEKGFEISDHFSLKTIEPNKDRFIGKMILLVNGNTASAAGALASRIKDDKRGLIVGEENRDNYVGFSAGVPVVLTLPYSGIVISIPIRRFTYASGEDTGRGVVIDYQMPTTHDDFFKSKMVVTDQDVTELLKYLSVSKE